ncbi:hypothetical protein [uncultured Metabacillus sp.]|uniref:hypothetical protein n=1 Tax=Metabacillus sp. Hm71 TaxID=3450743 RepID=UPI0026043C9C|nr:hypothetical protein [uncultured Metabacillus sp.]
MIAEKELLTKEELEIVTKLEAEMMYALTLSHMNFYKNEIQTIISQAKRRHQFLSGFSKV